MSKRGKRFLVIGIGVVILALIVTLVLNAFKSNLVFFFTPTQISQGQAPKGQAFRVGGMVKEGSLKQLDLSHEFLVTDNEQDVRVVYKGLLPDLFKEGKGVVAQGALGDNGVFIASQVLAKHDENYMPPEAKEAMDQAALRKASQSVQTP
ncbi:MAG: cytochrome c maturation protein CcmE [Betaproteobacteria bacterium]|jgi:cytochrome c-type biogenesis protein CcmE